MARPLLFASYMKDSGSGLSVAAGKKDLKHASFPVSLSGTYCFPPARSLQKSFRNTAPLLVHNVNKASCDFPQKSEVVHPSVSYSKVRELKESEAANVQFTGTVDSQMRSLPYEAVHGNPNPQARRFAW